MSRKTVRAAKFFLIFFCLGLGAFLLIGNISGTSKPILNSAKGVSTVGSVSDVAKKVSPSIVGISNLSRNGDMFNQRSSEATGSGVILDKEGHVVTNYHVVKDAQQLIVSLADGKQKEATLVGIDPRTDLAVIKIETGTNIVPASLGNSDKLIVGQEVVAIGNPLGLRFARSVTAGVVSGLNRMITTEEGFVFRLIQTDAAINPGNSGGALVNLDGQVIGINTIKIAVPGFEGMGFSIPSQQVKMVVSELLKNGRVLRPIMGIKILGEISADEAKHYNLSINKGVVVAPTANGPAQQAGMKEFDIITKINGEEIATGQELQDKIFTHKVGDSIDVQLARIPRQGTGSMETKTLKIKLVKDSQ